MDPSILLSNASELSMTIHWVMDDDQQNTKSWM
jgi:hypothetical protein